MTVLFRVDASAQIGTGHVMRCAALAQALMARGNRCVFLSRELPDSMATWLEERGIRVIRPEAAFQDDAAACLPVIRREAPDWLVVDHYGLDAAFETAMRAAVPRVMVIDDLANRPHDADLLVDQNGYDDLDTRYERWVPTACRQLLGPRYALLREEFPIARQTLQRTYDRCERLLVSFGGSDAGNMTGRVLEAIQRLDTPELHVDVLIGVANPNRAAVEALAASIPNVQCHLHVDDMAQRMRRADLFIGAGGSTTWERCCLGLPSIMVAIADNQEALSEHAHRQGLALYLGREAEVTVANIAEAIGRLRRDPAARKAMGERGMAAVDGRGCERVTRALLEFAPAADTIGFRRSPAVEWS